MLILMTGATGFVGRYLHRGLLREAEHTLYVITRKNFGFNNQILWDLKQEIPLHALPKKIDVILHLAQSTRYKEFPEEAMDMFQVNVKSTAALLDYAVKAKASHFILMSTGSVYEPYLNTCVEEANLRPKGYYPASKYASEILAKTYTDFFKVCIFRLFFPYGPGQTARLIPELINKIKQEIPIKLSGKGGGSKITPLYIDNLVEIVLQAIYKQWDGIINLASPEICSIQRIAKTLSKLLGVDLRFEIDLNEKPLFIQPGLDKLNLLYPNFDFVTLEQGLTKMLRHELLVAN